MTFAQLEKELVRCYGSPEGHRVYNTVAPGILADFLKMYQKAGIGETVREEYHLEDRKGTIVLQSLKNNDPARIEAEFISKAGV